MENTFQYILTNYNENEIYEMKEDTLNNIYEDIDKTNQFQDMKKVVATLQVWQQPICKVLENFIKSVRKMIEFYTYSIYHKVENLIWCEQRRYLQLFSHL